jgi:hypothetical protein
MIRSLNLVIIIILVTVSFAGCPTAKLEASLEAEPQCKPIMNPKTGSLMPCPAAENGLYTSLGLMPSKVQSSSNTSAISTGLAINPSVPQALTKQAVLNSTTRTSAECKPQLHRKTGSVLPCPVD